MQLVNQVHHPFNGGNILSVLAWEFFKDFGEDQQSLYDSIEQPRLYWVW